MKCQRFDHECAQNTEDKHQTLRPLELSSCSSIKEIDDVSQLMDSPAIKKWIQDWKQHFKDVKSNMSILDIFNHSCYKELKNFQDHGFWVLLRHLLLLTAGGKEVLSVPFFVYNKQNHIIGNHNIMCIYFWQWYHLTFTTDSILYN